MKLTGKPLWYMFKSTNDLLSMIVNKYGDYFVILNVRGNFYKIKGRANYLEVDQPTSPLLFFNVVKEATWGDMRQENRDKFIQYRNECKESLFIQQYSSPAKRAVKTHYKVGDFYVSKSLGLKHFIYGEDFDRFKVVTEDGKLFTFYKSLKINYSHVEFMTLTGYTTCKFIQSIDFVTPEVHTEIKKNVIRSIKSVYYGLSKPCIPAKVFPTYGAKKNRNLLLLLINKTF